MNGDINSLKSATTLRVIRFSLMLSFSCIQSNCVLAGRDNFVHSKFERLMKTPAVTWSGSDISIISHHFIIMDIIHGKITHLSCPQRTGSVVQGLTTGGKCYHCNPHDRSCWLCPPPPPSHFELWGTDLGHLWDYETEFEVMAMIWIDSCFGLFVTVFSLNHINVPFRPDTFQS